MVLLCKEFCKSSEGLSRSIKVLERKVTKLMEKYDLDGSGYIIYIMTP